jgi:hypothetical protein
VRCCVSLKLVLHGERTWQRLASRRRNVADWLRQRLLSLIFHASAEELSSNFSR